MDRSGLIESLSSTLGVPAGEIKVERSSARTNHVMHPEDRKLDTTEYVPASVCITIDERHLEGRSFGGRVPESPLSPKPHWTTPPLYVEDQVDPVIGRSTPIGYRIYDSGGCHSGQKPTITTVCAMCLKPVSSFDTHNCRAANDKGRIPTR